MLPESCHLLDQFRAWEDPNDTTVVLLYCYRQRGQLGAAAAAVYRVGAARPAMPTGKLYEILVGGVVRNI
jgi:hypothetical protein